MCTPTDCDCLNPLACLLASAVIAQNTLQETCSNAFELFESLREDVFPSFFFSYKSPTLFIELVGPCSVCAVSKVRQLTPFLTSYL